MASVLGSATTVYFFRFFMSSQVCDGSLPILN